MYETAKFQVNVQVTVENLTEMKEVAATCGISIRGAYSSILLQCWAAGNSSGSVYLVDTGIGEDEGRVGRFYWDSDDEPGGLPTGHTVVGTWVWYFEDLAGDQVTITGGGV